jgi:hypothetical protein
METANLYSFETRFPINPDFPGFPFRRELSLAPLVAAWQEPAHRNGGVAAAFGREVQRALRDAPALLEPLTDAAPIARHRELVDVLMAKVFPAAFWEQELAAALYPFQLRAFYATPSLRRLLLDDDGVLHGRLSIDERAMALGRLVRTYTLILRKYYDLDLGFDYPLILTVVDPASRLERHLRLQLDFSFLDIDAVGGPPPLADADRARLLANPGDPELLMELIPPSRFVLRGFVVLKALDVTDQEVLSSIKRDLIERESIVSTARFQRLQTEVCTLLRHPDLRLGLAAIQGEQVFMLNSGSSIRYSCLFADSVHRTTADFAGSVYERAVRQGQPLIVDDLARYADRTPIEEALLHEGIRNLVVAPLYYEGVLIGTLDLGSPQPGTLNAVTAMKLREVLPLFSMAVRRSVEELNSRIQAIIKERCTAIHPAVEWRFRQAALRSIERRAVSAGAEMEPIVFRDVYPLYAATDIRGSSTQRNVAIQADLVAHLGLARDVIRRAHAARPLPIFDELAYRIDAHVTQLEGGLASNDEQRIIAFLREHVEPRFPHLAGFGPAVREALEAYRAAVDARLGTVYQQRKAYEESVTLINETVSSYLDSEQAAAQAMFPHYFEKQQTDGIDYSIYIGGALVPDGAFDELYLKNLRLWQLLVTCGIAQRTDALRGRLPVPLDTAHLILVQHAPLSIRFRFDEKRFDVDGAYNVRYEVIKKRIDKARVRGTAERATQPGRLVVVYAHAGEAAEYRQYLDYLRARGYLTGELEELELEELQGVQGLRALRAAIVLTAPEPAPQAVREAEAGVRTLIG